MELQDLLPVGVTLVVVGLVLAFGLQVMGEMKSDMCDDGYTFNTTSDSCYLTLGPGNITRTAQLNGTLDGIEGVGKFPSKIPLVATVVVAVVVIGILIRYFTTK